MSYSAEIIRLTSDAGARRLAQIVDEMQAQVNACCGGSIAAKGSAKAAPDSPPSSDSAKDKKR